MPELRYEKFIGLNGEEATLLLATAMADGSFPVMRSSGGVPLMWITQQEVVPGVMQAPTFVIHVIAWVDMP